jgi:hypothetical protein
VREQVVAAIIRFDEAEAFGIVEPFHSASRHVISLSKGFCLKLCPSPLVSAMWS